MNRQDEAIALLVKHGYDAEAETLILLGPRDSALVVREEGKISVCMSKGDGGNAPDSARTISVLMFALDHTEIMEMLLKMMVPRGVGDEPN